MNLVEYYHASCPEMWFAESALQGGSTLSCCKTVGPRTISRWRSDCAAHVAGILIFFARCLLVHFWMNYNLNPDEFDRNAVLCIRFLAKRVI